MSRRFARYVLGVAVVVLTGCGPSAGHARHASHRGALPQVDLKATPPGWVPVAYGNLQISVPPTWIINGGCSVDGQGSIYFGTTPKQVCTSRSNIVVLRSDDTSLQPDGTQRSINGIPVSWLGPENNTLRVPSLHGSVDVFGPLANEVSNTLSASPRAVALASDPAPTIPRSWHRVSVGGLSAAVPRSWPVQRPVGWSYGCPPTDLTLGQTRVVLTTETVAETASCPPLDYTSVEAPRDGLVVDASSYGAFGSNQTYGPCIEVNGLSVCPTTSDPYGVLVASVHVPGRSTPVVVEIGLAGDGMTARTILHSLRAA